MSVKNAAANNVSPTSGVGVLVWQKKRLLLGKRLNKDESFCWQFPGGHLENNESIIECAQREVLEETGLQISKLRHLGFTDKPFEINQRQYVTLLVSCEYESGKAQALEPDKCETWQWFDYTKLPSPLFLPIRLFLAQQQKENINASADAFDSTGLYALHCSAKLIPA